MSVFELYYSHLREVFIFCFHLKKTATEAHQMLLSILTLRMLLVKERVASGFNASEAVILMLRTGMAVEKRKFRIGGITC